jgi:hypothetical protein
VGTKSVIAPRDLTWLGAWQTAATFNRYSRPSLGLRYVGGERRFLFHEWRASGGGIGDIVEMRAPANPAFYTGTDMASAPAMVETRRWAGADWSQAWMSDSTLFPQASELGSLYWDEIHGVLWFCIYGPYATGRNTPTWGAVELLDTVKTGAYCNVGSIYGPWHYRSTSLQGNLFTYARQVNQWIVPVPPSGQALIGGSRFLIGAGHTGYNGDAPWGPNLHALADLSPRMPNPVPLLRALAEYSPESPLTRRGCRRDGTHYHPSFSGSGPYQNEVINGEGTWFGGCSMVKGICWVDTGTKHGIVKFGEECQGGVGYWHANPKGDEPYPNERDPTLPTGIANSPKATEHYLWLRIFNPDHLAEVWAGRRVPYADTYSGKPGMRLAYEVNMRENITNGANIPILYSKEGDALQPRAAGPSTDFGGAVWDPKAGQAVWMQYRTAPSGVVLCFFSVT